MGYAYGPHWRYASILTRHTPPGTRIIFHHDKFSPHIDAKTLKKVLTARANSLAGNYNKLHRVRWSIRQSNRKMFTDSFDIICTRLGTCGPNT